MHRCPEQVQIAGAVRRAHVVQQIATAAAHNCPPTPRPRDEFRLLARPTVIGTFARNAFSAAWLAKHSTEVLEPIPRGSQLIWSNRARTSGEEVNHAG